MVPDSHGRTAITLVVLSLSSALLSRPAVAQTWITSDLEPTVSIPIQFGVSFVANVVLGGLVLAVAPRYAHDIAETIRDDAIGSLLAGVLATVLVLIATVVLAITIVGLLVVIPGVLVLAVVQFAATGIAILAVGAALVGRTRLDGTALLAGSVVVALVGLIPLVGPLLNSAVSITGFGAVASDYWASR